MTEGAQLRFLEAVRHQDFLEVADVLPNLTPSDIELMRERWFSGQLGQLDPTNILCAADCADQFLSLPQHAIALYDAALEYMDKHPDSIAEDTDCAASSLNLIDFLVKSGQKQAAASAAKRASRMPVKRPEQNVQIAFWLSQAGDMKTAHLLFQRGKAAGLATVAAAMGVPVEDLNQMEQILQRAAQSSTSGDTSVKQSRPACVLCDGDIDLRGAPLDVKMMVDEGLAPAICGKCVVSERIPVEGGTVQNRIWHEGEKFLSYGDCFVQI